MASALGPIISLLTFLPGRRPSPAGWFGGCLELIEPGTWSMPVSKGLFPKPAP
jgi:hypothetical protein